MEAERASFRTMCEPPLPPSGLVVPLLFLAPKKLNISLLPRLSTQSLPADVFLFRPLPLASFFLRPSLSLFHFADVFEETVATALNSYPSIVKRKSFFQSY